MPAIFIIPMEASPPHYIQITGPAPVPSGFYATRVSSKLAWIYSMIDPTGDNNGNGRSNLARLRGDSEYNSAARATDRPRC